MTVRKGGDFEQEGTEATESGRRKSTAKGAKYAKNYLAARKRGRKADGRKQCQKLGLTLAPIAKNYPNAALNYQKYYVGIRTDRNLAFLKLQKKKLRVVVMLPEQDVRTVMKHHVVKQLSQSVQGFYNGPCCAVLFENSTNLDDFWALLKTLIK